MEQQNGGVMIMKAAQMPARREIMEALIEEPRATEAEIRARAYEIYLGRGDEPGDAVSDWLQAEAELQPERAAAQVA
jgi:hypothetical protein